MLDQNREIKISTKDLLSSDRDPNENKSEATPLEESKQSNMASSTAVSAASQAADALRNIFVDVSGAADQADGNGDYSDEEEAQFHAQYQEKHFVQFIEALDDIVIATQERAQGFQDAATAAILTKNSSGKPDKQHFGGSQTSAISQEEVKVPSTPSTLKSQNLAAAMDSSSSQRGQPTNVNSQHMNMITQRNQQMVVEIIRNIAEYAIYSEKFNRNFMDNLIEQNVFQNFSQVLNQNNRLVNIQLIQTTSILLQNIKAEEKKYYILSHPFLNKLISFKFNFYDEELVDTFISFLKALALSIDSTTIKFFMNARTNNFPLLAITCKFFNHGETMVKNAARIIILTIFQLNDPLVNKLLLDLPFCTFFAHLGCYLKDMIVKIDETHNPSALVPVFPSTGTLTFQKPQEQHSMGRKSFPLASFNFGGASAANANLGAQPQQMQPSQSAAASNPYVNDIQVAAAQASQKRSGSPNAKRSINFDKLQNYIEDLQDAVEFLNELFEQCAANKTVIKLLTNALLHYCYFPVVMPALVGTTKSYNAANISISTALYMMTITLKQIKSQSLHNALALVLIHDRLPLGFKRLVQTKNPVADPNVSYRFKWMYRLPVHYSKTKFLQEFYSLQCGDTFVKEFAPSIKFCRTFDDLLYSAQQECMALDDEDQPHIYEEETKSMNSARSLEREVQQSQMHLGVIKDFLSEGEFDQVVAYHYQISQGLGHPVGLVNMLHRVPPQENEPAFTQQYPIENLYERTQNMLVRLLEKTQQGAGQGKGDDIYADDDIIGFNDNVVRDKQPFGLSAAALSEKNQSIVDMEGKIVENDLKKQFMTYLLAKDDNLLLQTSGCLLTLVMHSKVSQSLLYHSQMFPVGINRKSMLLQRLLEAPESPSKVVKAAASVIESGAAGSNQASPSKPQVSLGSYDSQSSLQKERQPSQRSQLSSRGLQDDSKIQSMEQNFQKFLLQRCQQNACFYDESLVRSLIRALQPEALTNSLMWEESPPFRSLTFRVLTTLLFQLTFNRKCMPSSLKGPEKNSLLRAYRTAAQNLLAAFDVRIARIRPSASTILTQLNGGNQDQVWHERVVQLINEEFSALKSQMNSQMNDLSDLERILENQLVMISAIPDEENTTGHQSRQKSKTPAVTPRSSKPRHIPEALKHPCAQMDMLKARIRVFWLLRFLVLFLTRYDTELNKLIKQNPMLADLRPVETWQEGQVVKLDSQQPIDSVLCVIRLNQKMVVRHVLLDPEYFLLVEVDQDDILKQQEQAAQAQGSEPKIATVRSQTVVDMRNVTITIHKKVPLRSVESLIDRSEPRNLILGFVHATKATTQTQANAFAAKASQKKKSILAFRGNPSSANPKAEGGAGGVQMMPPTENLEEMLLYFEHHTKCTYVKNMLDLKKQSLRKRIVTQAKDFLQKSIDDLPEIEDY